MLTNYVSQKKEDAEAKPKQPDLQFAFIWQNLDNLFKQMSQDDVNELNLQFMTQAIAKIQKQK